MHFGRPLRRLATASVGLSVVAGALLGAATPVTAMTASTSTPSIVRTASPPFPGNLIVGSRGAAVAAVQRGLLSKGYRIPGISVRSSTSRFGYLSSTTMATIMRFKASHNLGPSRAVGPKTYAAITGFGVSKPAPKPSAPSSSPRYTSLDQCAGLADPTVTARTRSARAGVSVFAFVHSRMGCKVTVRESGGNCSVSNPSGKYMGKWQLDMWEWPNYGGLAFAARPNLASCAQQDVIAYRNWRDRGWEPWTTAY